MIRKGVEKRRTSAYAFVQGDAERLPIPDASFDAACVGFGIRNVSSLDQALAEVARVLRPEGRFVVLEFTTPPGRLLRPLYLRYFQHVLPRVGGWVSGRPEAYRYLPESVAEFPSPEGVARKMSGAGFRDVRWSLVHGGIAAIHSGRR
jgi:demethylmenaquinone methyltransferase/2-methoxy-6-polyprenyl-1,4-benzoquinol methylase